MDTTKPTTKIEIGLKMREIDAELKELKEREKALNAEYDDLERNLIQLMLNAEESSFSDQEGNGYYFKTRLFASVKADTKEEAYAAFKESDFKALVTETINANSLSSAITNWREEQEKAGAEHGSMPEFMKPFINAFDKTTIGFSKKSKK